MTSDRGIEAASAFDRGELEGLYSFMDEDPYRTVMDAAIPETSAYGLADDGRSAGLRPVDIDTVYDRAMEAGLSEEEINEAVLVLTAGDPRIPAERAMLDQQHLVRSTALATHAVAADDAATYVERTETDLAGALWDRDELETIYDRVLDGEEYRAVLDAAVTDDGQPPEVDTVRQDAMDAGLRQGTVDRVLYELGGGHPRIPEETPVLSERRTFVPRTLGGLLVAADDAAEYADMVMELDVRTRDR